MEKTVVNLPTPEKENSEINHSCVSPRQGCLKLKVISHMYSMTYHLHIVIGIKKQKKCAPNN